MGYGKKLGDLSAVFGFFLDSPASELLQLLYHPFHLPPRQPARGFRV